MKKWQPMLAHMGDQSLLDNQNYIFEPKLDGVRALCFVSDNKLTFISRNDIDLTTRYPELQCGSKIKVTDCILDGEIIAYDQHGVTKFSLLQQGTSPVYVVFDILMLNGESLIYKPLLERKQFLEHLVINSPCIEKIFFTTKGKDLWHLMEQQHAEGVIAKDPESLYRPGVRTRAWLKIKFHQSADCVIIGYTTQKRSMSSLALGLYDKQHNLHYIGKVGTGFNEKTIKALTTFLYKIELEKMPSYAPAEIRDVVWVKPLVVGEIKYAEVTRDRRLRSPVFMRVRFDKDAKDCFLDQLKNK